MMSSSSILNPQKVEDILKNTTISPTTWIDPALLLPDHILHSIFSYLSSDDLYNVRLVNKYWHRNTPSYIVFYFDEFIFRRKIPSISSHHDYLESTISSLKASQSKLINADKRILDVTYNTHQNIDEITKLLDEQNFHEVYLRFIYAHHYNSLGYIFQSKCLTILHLTKCGFFKDVFCGVEIIPSLQELKLENVAVSEDNLSKFVTTKCPYIRELSLVNCPWLRDIVIPKLDRLKKLYVKMIDNYYTYINIQVIASSLQVFHFVFRSHKTVAVAHMDIPACRMLQEFYLDCLKFPIGLDHENICSDFPHLETLLMRSCETEKPLKILGPSLKKCVLSFPPQYEYSRQIIVSVPNSSFFQYMDAPILPSLDTSELLESIILVLVPQVDVMNGGWFLKLRSHLERFSNYNTILDLRICEEKSYFVGKYPKSKLNGRTPTQPLHHIKHLTLDMIKLKFQQEYLMRYIIDDLLWMSHPNSLTLSIPTSFASLAYGVSKQLYDRRDRNCCSGTHEKCWRHFLKHFEVKEEVIDEKEDMLKLIFVFTWRFNS